MNTELRERLRKYEGLNKDKERCPPNPCITVRETIEIADYIAELELFQETFNAVINFAITLGLEADMFLQYWREGDWDACKEFGFMPDAQHAGE